MSGTYFSQISRVFDTFWTQIEETSHVRDINNTKQTWLLKYMLSLKPFFINIFSKLAPCTLECNGQPCNSDDTACDCQNGSSQSNCSGPVRAPL